MKSVAIILTIMGFWCQTASAQKVYSTNSQYQADKKVFFVEHEYQADLKVYFTDKEYRAGWKKNDKKPLMS